MTPNQVVIDAAEFTRKDLGLIGSNYPHVRHLLAFAEAAIEQAKAAPAEVPYALRQWAMEDEPESTLFDEGYNAARRWVKMQLEKPAEPEGDVVKVPRELLSRWECELDQIPNAFHISDEMAALLGGAGCD